MFKMMKMMFGLKSLDRGLPMHLRTSERTLGGFVKLLSLIESDPSMFKLNTDTIVSVNWPKGGAYSKSGSPMTLAAWFFMPNHYERHESHADSDRSLDFLRNAFNDHYPELYQSGIEKELESIIKDLAGNGRNLDSVEATGKCWDPLFRRYSQSDLCWDTSIRRTRALLVFEELARRYPKA